jgi:hypothetical protein
MRSGLIAATLAAGVILMSGCGESGGSAESETAEYPPAKSYTVAGVVAAKPSLESPGTELMVTHEEIPDFVGQSGEVVGMRAMTMPFPNVAEDVLLDEIEVGDSVRMTFLVDYSADPIYIVTEMEEVNAGPAESEPSDAGE